MRTLYSLNRVSRQDAIKWLELCIKRGNVGVAMYDTGSEMGTVIYDRSEASFGKNNRKFQFTPPVRYVSPEQHNLLAARVLELEKTEVVFEGVIKRR